MPERRTRKTGTFPSPFHLAFLLIAIAIATLIVGLLLFGALGNFFAPPSVIKQAQAVESPTSETVEPTTEIPTTNLTATVEITATLEPSPTLAVAETATLEPSPTPTETETPTGEPTEAATTEPTLPPTETVVAETPTVSVEPTQTEIPTTKVPRVTPTNTLEPSPTFALATDTPVAENGTILFESSGALYALDVDEQGKARAMPDLLTAYNPGKQIIGKVLVASYTDKVFLELVTGANCDSCEQIATLYVLSSRTGEMYQIEPPTQPGKIFGWHPNGVDLIYGDRDGTIGLFNVETKESQVIAQVQDWLKVPWSPIVYGIAFSPDATRLIASFGLTGQGIQYQAWVANADGSDARFAIESNSPIFGLAWSPNGKNITFVSNGLEVMGNEGQERRTLSTSFSVGWGFEPVWSPDGRYIAFEAREALPPYKNITNEVQTVFQYHKIHLFDLEANDKRRLINDEMGGDINPAWSPDGQHLVFLSNRSGISEVWTASVDGKELSQLTTDEQPKRADVFWQDTSRR